MCSSYIALIKAAVGGRVSSTNIKIAFSGASLIRLRITYTNCPTVRSCAWRGGWKKKERGREKRYQEIVRCAMVAGFTHRGYQVLLFIYRRDVRPVCFLADYLFFRRTLCYIHVEASLKETRMGQHTGIRSGYFWRMRSASALRFSV